MRVHETVNTSGDKIEEIDNEGNVLEEWQTSSVMLNPSSEVRIHEDDEIIVLLMTTTHIK